jgi:hypothetical protein
MHIYKDVLPHQTILEYLAPDTKKPPAVLEAFTGTLAGSGLPRPANDAANNKGTNSL